MVALDPFSVAALFVYLVIFAVIVMRTMGPDQDQFVNFEDGTNGKGAEPLLPSDEKED